jgi:MFS transporter, NNP family, nitrate/nitrite transporter
VPALSVRLADLADPKIRTLHMAWLAFFLTFVVWFNHAPLLALLREDLGLGDAQIRALLILNVALTIPARIGIGMAVDRFGPRVVYTGLLVAAGVLSFAFSLAQNFEQLALARFALGFVGAGFVIGIRLVGEWFPARQVGLAEGIYGGFGNFGSAAAAVTLPGVAYLAGGTGGWRAASAATGVIALGFALLFYRSVRDTPKGSTYFKPRRSGGIEVSTPGDFALLIAMNTPLYLALGVLAWRLSPAQIGLLPAGVAELVYVGLTGIFALHSWQTYRVNQEMFRGGGVPALRRYHFSQVAVLDVAYMISFGSELAVVSMLPLFFLETFAGLSPITAGLFGSGFACLALVARPAGGWVSDRYGRKRTLFLLVMGIVVGYFALSQMNGSWPIGLATLATLLCAVCVHGCNGAVFAMVPLVQRRMTGQIAGMAGAYGNVGGVLFLTVLSLVDYSTFFLVIAVSSLVALAALLRLEEPRGHMTEVLEDGSVQLIEVS